MQMDVWLDRGELYDVSDGGCGMKGGGMKRVSLALVCVTLMLCGSTAWGWGRKETAKPLEIRELSVKGEIEKENITFTLDFLAEIKRKDQEIPLVTGDMVLDSVVEPKKGYRVRYDKETKTYYLSLQRGGKQKVAVSFAARPVVMAEAQWRESQFSIPASRIRRLEVVCDRTDLEVRFPGALRLNRDIKDGKLVITAILGPGRPFAVRWKPQVGELEGKLVLSSTANTVALASPGALRLDTLFVFDISQGKLRELDFTVPKALSVTQVSGTHIRDWRIAGEGDAQKLSVILNRPLTKQYALQIISETVLPKFPCEVTVPVIEPQGGIRAGGNLSIGTDSAIQLMVKKTGGLSQVDASAFPRIVLDREHSRRLPRAKVFYYAHATSPYQLGLHLDDIVSSYDASQRIVTNIKEDDLTMDCEIEVDVRDAPVRTLVLEVPKEYVVARVTGAQVEEEGHTVRDLAGNDAKKEVEVNFRAPVVGRTVVGLRLELGKGPLGRTLKIDDITVRGAKTERGYIVVVAEKGIRIRDPKVTGLRQVHTGSVPMRVPNAAFAYRFREKGWSMEMLAHKTASEIRVESFHLISIGEGVLYGSVAANYFITGAPVDVLKFKVPEFLKNVEFVGKDVSRWKTEDGIVTVKLQRKVVGDYNLGVTYTQRYTGGEALSIGSVECVDVQTQTGYITVASHLNLRLSSSGQRDPSLLEIDRDEIPPNYRLLVNAPILRTYKYVGVPHGIGIAVNVYDRESLLPVVVEVVEISTDIAVGENRETESITRVRYKVKNSSSQFLPLVKPENANVWGAHLIQTDRRGGEERVRLSFGEDRDGVLMIPLDRHRNPNEPITVEVEYGQVHGNPGWLGRLALESPRSSVRSTFANWTVTVPDDWSVLAGTGGNMVADERGALQGNLSAIMSRITSSWNWAFHNWVGDTAMFFLALAAMGLLGFFIFMKRSAVPYVALAMILVFFLWVGIRAAQSPYWNGWDSWQRLSTIRFTQALRLGEDNPLAVAIRVVPTWRQYATFRGTILLPGVALLCLLLGGLKRGWRKGMYAFGIVGLMYSAAQFPGASTVMGHAFTWGIPAAAALFIIGRGVSRVRGRASLPAAVTALLAAGILLGCATSQAEAARKKNVKLPDVPPVLERVECDLKAEKDSMEIAFTLKLKAEKPARFPLGARSPILLSSDKPVKYVELKEEGGIYYVDVQRKGTYEIKVKFLSPLAKVNDNQMRWFRMPLPLALTNLVNLSVPKTGMEITAPTAVRLIRKEDDKSTSASAILGPGDDVHFVWQPRVRKTYLEKISFFSELTSLIRFDAGLVEGRHRVSFQIAQGELKDITIEVPANMTITAVEGEDIGAWRFDPAKHELEVRLSTPATGRYALTVVSQISLEEMPSKVSVSSLKVKDAVHQRETTGLQTTTSVHIKVEGNPQPMNVDDFVRNAARAIPEAECLQSGSVRHAFRTQRADEVITVDVHRVRPEIRSKENSTFTVADDRLVYNGQVAIQTAKAGVFSVNMRIPTRFDIDSLTGPQVSHWDEAVEGDTRIVQVHFNVKLLGQADVNVTLSRPESDLPEEIEVPRIEVEGALKHTGRMVVSAARGVRLSVAARKGVSEVNPQEINIRTKGTLVFRLLRPDWELKLGTEVVKPRINVDFLHVAEATEGLVRHTHYMRYRLHNAGSKFFRFRVPAEALGLVVTGPGIARKEKADESGLWQVELSNKWFDRPFPLTLRYETKFDMSGGKMNLAPVEAVGVDLQKGTVIVKATDRVELASLRVGEMLQPADARSIPREFGAGDQSDAAFCYTSAGARYQLALSATRHGAAELLEAEVLQTNITTVVNELGEHISRIEMQLRVGGKRHLETVLPRGAKVWSLMVNRRSTVPSKTKDDAGREVLLIPIAQASVGELPVSVDLVYAVPASSAWTMRHQQYAGPQFDMPLKNINWKFHVPEGYRYYDFEGTLSVNETLVETELSQKYDVDAYEAEVLRNTTLDRRKAIDYQTRGDKLAKEGRQYEARQALENAYNYSFSDPGLNEDARVQLHRLNKQQALVGLVGARDRLRQQTGQPAPTDQGKSLGDSFTQQEAEQVQSSLSMDDNGNLEQIVERIIETQKAAAGTPLHLIINMPVRGRVLEFKRPLQVKPGSDMLVSFAAKETMPTAVKRGWGWAAGLFVMVVLLLSACPYAETGWSRVTAAMAKKNDDNEDGVEVL